MGRAAQRREKFLIFFTGVTVNITNTTVFDRRTFKMVYVPHIPKVSMIRGQMDGHRRHFDGIKEKNPKNFLCGISLARQAVPP